MNLQKQCGSRLDHRPHKPDGINTITCPGWPVDTRLPYSEAAQEAYEEIDHPKHYGGSGPYEVIAVLEAWGDMFHLVNNINSAIKYMIRAGLKPGSSRKKDLQKALWHLEREIARCED